MTHETDKTTKSLFDSAISIELIAGRIYRDFSKFFSYEPDIASFWDGMCDDENKHAEILKETRDSISSEIMGSPADPTMWEKMAVVKSMMGKAVYKEVNNLDDAYDLAHQIESSEIEAIFKFLTLEYFSSPLREAFISSEIVDHQSKLMTFSEKFGPKTWRREIMAVKGMMNL